MSNPIRILIVDDDVNLRKTLGDILKAKGFAPVTCETGMEALERVGQEEIVVALVDLRLADISGLEVVHGIKQRSPQTECILLTGHASQATAIEAVNLGVYSYHQKPYDIDQLLLSIRHAAGKFQAGKELAESQARYHTFINATTDMAFLKDELFRYLIVNQAATSLFRKPGAEIIGRDDFELLPADVAQAIRQGDEQVLQAEKLVITVQEMRGRIYELREFPVDLQDGRLGVGGYVRDITESRRAEIALRESEERYRMLAENMSDTVWLMDMNLKNVYISPSVIRTRGYTLEELNAIPLDQQMTPDSINRAMKLFAEVLSPENLASTGQQIVRAIELEFFKKDGSKIWSENTFVLIRNADGQPVNILGSGRDITDRKQAEEFLRASEERFRVIFENANDAIHIDNADDEILDVNSRMCELMGYSREELLRMHVTDLQVPERRQPGSLIKKELSLHGNKVFEGINLHRDGRHIPVEISIAQIELPSGDLYASIVRDITERKQAEEALQNSEKRFRALIENGRDNISLVAADGTLLWENPSTTSTLGYAFNQFVGRNIFELMHPDEQARALDLFEQIVQTAGHSLESIFRLRHSDGSWRWIEGTITNLLNEPSVRAIIINYRDISGRIQAEEALRKSEESFRNVFENTTVGLYRTTPEGDQV